MLASLPANLTAPVEVATFTVDIGFHAAVVVFLVAAGRMHVFRAAWIDGISDAFLVASIDLFSCLDASDGSKAQDDSGKLSSFDEG